MTATVYETTLPDGETTRRVELFVRADGSCTACLWGYHTNHPFDLLRLPSDPLAVAAKLRCPEPLAQLVINFITAELA